MILKRCSRTLSMMNWTTMMKTTWRPWTPMMSMKSLMRLKRQGSPSRDLLMTGWPTY